MKNKKSKHFQFPKNQSHSVENNKKSNVKNTSVDITPTDQHNKTIIYIIEFFRRSWKSINFMRWLAIISTLLTISLGSFDVINLVSFKINSVKIESLRKSINDIPNFSDSQLQKWERDLEKFKGDLRFQDEYNYMKGCLIQDNKVKDIKSLVDENLSPDFYFKRVSPTSKLFKNCIINRYASYRAITDNTVRRKKMENLVEDLEDISYTHPVYYMFKADVSCMYLNGDSISKSYNEFANEYPYFSEYPFISISKGSLLKLDITSLMELRAIDFFYMLFLFMDSENIQQKEMAKTKLEFILNSQDNEFNIIKSGFDELMIPYPLFDAQNYTLSRMSLPNYINHQKYLIKMLLLGRYKIK